MKLWVVKRALCIVCVLRYFSVVVFVCLCSLRFVVFFLVVRCFCEVQKKCTGQSVGIPEVFYSAGMLLEIPHVKNSPIGFPR